MRLNFFQVLTGVAVLLSLLCLPAFADSDIDKHCDCKHCGMDRKAFGYSRMLVEYKDGTQVGTCSIHCVATELNNGKSEKVSAFKVADRNSRKLIDATNAFWVIGGSKRGVMTSRAKWAFVSRETAQKFVTAYGGVIATWNDALAAAREDAAPKPR
jgi:nitrous oxide reductase accessory protein NosL